MNTMKQTILITGINGFIGRRAAHALRDRGHEVCGLDRAAQCFDTDLPYAQADITDEAALARAFERLRPTAVLHLAALVHNNNADLSDAAFERINHQASRTLFRLCKQYDVGSVVFSSTIEVYGESDRTVIDEETPCAPASAYGQSKLRAEEALWREMPETCRRAALRFAPVYDRDFRLNLDKRFYVAGKRAAVYFRRGDYTFHFCSVRNILNFLCAWFGGDVSGGIYILSDRHSVSARQFLDMERRHGVRVPILRAPYWPAYAAIAVLEGLFRLVSRSEPFFSRYNFRKLFRSTVYSAERARRLVDPMDADMENTLYGE